MKETIRYNATGEYIQALNIQYKITMFFCYFALFIMAVAIMYFIYTMV